MASVAHLPSGGPSAPSLRADLEMAALEVRGALSLETLVQEVVRCAPDVDVCYESRPDDALFVVTAALQETAPLPFVLFTAGPDVVCPGLHRHLTRGVDRGGADSAQQGGETLSALSRALSQATFGDLLDGVLGAWTALEGALRLEVVPTRMAEVDTAAARLLAQAETLTRSLETADFAAEPRVVNVSGRQRMLAQRIAKPAIVAAIPGSSPCVGAERLQAEEDFARGLVFLAATPLRSPRIEEAGARATDAWRAFRRALADPAGLAEVARAWARRARTPRPVACHRAPTAARVPGCPSPCHA